MFDAVYAIYDRSLCEIASLRRTLHLTASISGSLKLSVPHSV